MRKYSLISLLTWSGCLGVLLIAMMFVAVVAVATQKLRSPFQSVCAPADAPGPEQLSNAPEPSPDTNGPSVHPASYTMGPDPVRPGGETVRNVALAPGGTANSIPTNYVAYYKAAGAKYGIPWSVLAGVGKIETDHGRSKLPGVSSGENYAHAGGPMQFIPGTWRGYGVDGPEYDPELPGDHMGKPDGKKSRYDPADAIPAAARYLRVLGVPAQTRKALYKYNGGSSDGSTDQAWQYADNVLSWAEKYGGNDFALDDPNYTGVACGALDNAASPLGKRIIDYAKRWLGKPYVWGGGNIAGPTNGGFDCSGLTLYAVYHATGGQITIPRTSQDQQKDRRGKPVSRSQLQPGDLVFFSSPIGTPPHHVGIYVGGGQMVHAPHTGTVVKIGPMDWTEFNGGLRFTATAKA